MFKRYNNFVEKLDIAISEHLSKVSSRKHMCDDNDEFNEEDFNKCFEEFDKDGSGTIEKDEMALFIKKVAGL